MQRFQINLCAHELLLISLSVFLPPSLSPVSPLSPDQDQASPLNIDSIEVSVGGADSSDEENNTSSDSDEERYNERIFFAYYGIQRTRLAVIHCVFLDS